MAAAPDGQTIAGGIIDIEHCEDVTATAPTWNLVAKTQDTVELSPNAENVDARVHEKFNLEKDVVSEAWEIAFSALLVTGPGQLQTLGLLTDDFREKGHADAPETDTQAIQITVYDDQAAKDAGEVKYQVASTNYVLMHDGGEIAVDDYSTVSFVIHSRERPIRVDLGGTLT